MDDEVLLEAIGVPTGDIEVLHDARISEVFYYFEQLTTLASGRTVGRKIGVMQETLLRKYLESSEELKRRMYLEQTLVGFSTAGHKVEFSWYSVSPHRVKVGAEIPGTPKLRLKSVSPEKNAIRIQTAEGKAGALVKGKPATGSNILARVLTPDYLDIRIRAIGADYVDLDIVDKTKLLASLESKRVGAQRFSGSEKLGSGIQTIEKAKQASLVAIDLDLQHNGNVKPLQSNDTTRVLLSFVALGNGVHWTKKDKNVLRTFVDFTYLVSDAAIIRYAKFVRGLAEKEEADFMKFFMAYFEGMTKQKPDAFVVKDSDFSIITPEDEDRTLLEVLKQHIVHVDSALTPVKPSVAEGT